MPDVMHKTKNTMLTMIIADRDIKADVLLASISGGTDIIACFMGENSTLPVYRGEIQVPAVMLLLTKAMITIR